MAAITLRCRHCLGTNMVDEKDLEERHFITCTYCREKLAITDFESGQLRYKQKLEEGEKAKQALERAEKALKEEQEKVWTIISDMDGLKGSLEEQEQQLGEILKASQADQETQGTILSLLRAMNHDQAQEKTSILSLLGRIADGQDTAQGKLSAIQSATAVLTEGHADISKAISEITDLLHADIAQKNQATHELLSWFNNRNEEERERLKRLNTISMTLLNGQEKSAAEISSLRKKAEETQETLKSLTRKIDQQKQDELVNLYHQAENLQLDMEFDKAEDEYRKVLIKGGRDPEVYWRIILCHYGVVYQKDNEGHGIPTILRPDLSLAFSAVPELENSCRTKEERAYYTPELKRITDLLDKYRHCQTAAQYDVFISVKQKTHYNRREAFTEDYKIGSDLYQYLTKKGLRVFNSEQENCKKPGEEWEPYILAALLSSKVMIVVGTSKENMESKWVQNEWLRFQWLQAEDKKKMSRTDRKLLCFIDNMTGDDLPGGLAHIEAIINTAGAYEQLDKVLLSSFPNIGNQPKPRENINVESIRGKMHNWLTFKKFDLVQEEYKKVIREGDYSLDVMITLYNICAEHKLSKVEELETASFDLEKEESVQIILENSRDQDGLRKLQEILKKNKEYPAHEKHSQIRRKRFLQVITVCLLLILALSFLLRLKKEQNTVNGTDPVRKEQRNISDEALIASSDPAAPSTEEINTLTGDVTGDGTVDLKDAITLYRYLYGLEADINLSNSDINSDGQVDFKDLILLKNDYI